jgi:hypothetical protein
MNCPSCKATIGLINSARLAIFLASRKAIACPHCNTSLYPQTNYTLEYFKLVIFVLFWIGLFLFLVAILFGQVLGYKSALIMCFCLWILAIAIFISIILCNLVVIILSKMFCKFIGKTKSSRSL